MYPVGRETNRTHRSHARYPPLPSHSYNPWQIEHVGYTSLVALLGPTVESDQKIAVRWPGPQHFSSKTRMSNHFAFKTS